MYKNNMARRPADPAWRAFTDALSRERTSALAESLGLPPEEVSELKASRRRPRFEDLPKISAALVGDPTHLARLMGMIPDDQNLMRHLQDLTERVNDLKHREASLIHKLGSSADRGVGELVTAVLREPGWSVGVWPAYEGPPTCKLHVADRIDIRRQDGDGCTTADVRALFGRELDELGAVLSSKSPRWSDLHRSDGDQAGSADTSPVSRWSVNRLNSSFPADQWESTHQAQSIAVVSTTVSSHPTDIAALLARVLGYANNSTRELVQFAFRGDYRDKSTYERRLLFHSRLMDNPRDHAVWSHFGVGDDPVRALPPTASGRTVVVWIRESDELIKGKWRTDDEVHQLVLQRDAVDRHISTLVTPVVVINIDTVGKERTKDYGNLEIERSLEAVSQGLNEMLARELVNRMDLTRRLERTAEAAGSDATVIMRYLRPKLQL